MCKLTQHRCRSHEVFSGLLLAQFFCHTLSVLWNTLAQEALPNTHGKGKWALKVDDLDMDTETQVAQSCAWFPLQK